MMTFWEFILPDYSGEDKEAFLVHVIVHQMMAFGYKDVLVKASF